MLRDVPFKALLTIGFLVAGLLPLMIFALMSYSASRNTLKQQAFRQIESIRNIKIHQLESFFNETKSQVRVFSESPVVRQFFRDMVNWHGEFQLKNKHRFLAGSGNGKFKSDSRYRKIHDKYFCYFRNIVKQLHFYDLFLIEPGDGLVVFTVVKEPDFGVVLSGTQSPLEKAWKQAKTAKTVILTDTRLYQPSRNVPAQFAIVKVKDGGKTVGYLAVQISIAAIDRIMGERSGMGNTGETYLVGEDHLMRSDSFTDPKGHSVLASLSGTLKKNGVETGAVTRALQGKTGCGTFVDYNGNRVLSAYGPVQFGNFSWALMAEINEREINRQIETALNKQILFIMLLSIALLLSLVSMISIFFSRGISRVTSETENLVDEILKGRLHARTDPDKVGRDFRGLVSKTNRLIDAFVNQIHERRKMEELMEYNQRMESIGTLAGGIAHDFNNILTYMFSYSDIIIGELKPGTKEYESMLEIQKAIHRAADLVSQIMTFSRQVRQEKKPVRISLIVKEIVKLLKSTLPKSIVVQKEIEEEDLYVPAEPSQLYQIAMNLCTNAFHAMQEKGGTLIVRLAKSKVVSPEKQPTCVLTIEDTGCGMDKETQKHIFEPYFTTKGPGQGSGMGLAVVHGICKALGAAINVQSTPGAGTCIEVVLPCVENPGRFEKAGVKVAGYRGSGRILFVDDEENIGKSTGKLLRSWGYSVVVTTDGFKADSLLKSKKMKDYLLITDLNMPGMTGFQLIRNMRLRGDMRPVILLTGYSEMLNRESSDILSGTTILFKPFTPEKLARVIREVLDSKENKK
ncbi:MAG: response regulator [Acidobacteria bacterium]|nr:response regulator [Acidobacteriota bacterium]